MTRNLYASLADFRGLFMDNLALDATDQSAVLRALDAGSRRVDEITRRHFYAVTDTRVFDGPGCDRVWIPDLLSATTIKLDEDKTQRIDNSLVRFRKVIQVPAFPPPGSKIALSVGSEMAFECEIGRADWHEAKQKFVLSCKYPKQRIFPHEYEALMNDPQWQRTEFPA